MARFAQQFKIHGMRQDDLIASGKSSQYAFCNHNLRFNTVGDPDTTLWTIEKGTSPASLVGESLPDPQYYIPIGQCVVDDIWVLFFTRRDGKDQNRDYIYTLRLEGGSLRVRKMFVGNLNFDVHHPLETLPFYETEDIKKVYWCDGINQPRMINAARYLSYIGSGNTCFDFVRPITSNQGLFATMTVEKTDEFTGVFPGGTVQYCIGYHNKYGQQSNIAEVSDMWYPVISDGQFSKAVDANNDILSSDAFKITVTNPSDRWEYVDLYSIIRTSEAATPVVRHVDSVKIDKTSFNGPQPIVFIDTNTKGSIIDPTVLLYMGGYAIVPETLDQKDNTLFLGNYTIKSRSIEDQVKRSLKEGTLTFSKRAAIPYKTSNVIATDASEDGVISSQQDDKFEYNWVNQLEAHGSFDVKTFKYGEYYDFAIRFQDELGHWSEACYIGRAQNTIKPSVDRANGTAQLTDVVYKLPYNMDYFEDDMSVSTLRQHIQRQGWLRCQLLVHIPEDQERSVIAQGVVTPTVYNEQWAVKDQTVYRQSDWFFRGFPAIIPSSDKKINGEIQSVDGVAAGVEEFASLSDATINSFDEPARTMLKALKETAESQDAPSQSFYVDYDKVLTFHSPDIQYIESIRNIDDDSYKLRVIGSLKTNNTLQKTHVTAIPADVDGCVGSGYIPSIQWIYGIWKDLKVFPGFNADGNRHNADDDASPVIPQNEYKLFPFQRRSLNDYAKDFDNTVGDKVTFSVTSDDAAYCDDKCVAFFRCSDEYTTFSDVSISYKNTYVDSTGPVPYRIYFNNSFKTYYGTINDVLPLSTFCYRLPIANQVILNSGANGTSNDPLWPSVSHLDAFRRITFHSNYPFYTDTIKMAYRSTPHGVLSLYDTNLSIKQLVHIAQDDVTEGHMTIDTSGSDQSYSWKKAPTFYIVELYRDINNTTAVSDQYLSEISFVPCGKVKLLSDPIVGGSFSVVGHEGDTYFQRYDCLKTYPYEIDTNQIVDVLSFMCETRVNLDGRYDSRNIGDITLLNNANFALVNKGYTQKNSFFSAFTATSDVANRRKFPNQFTWTKTKHPADEVDTWTNITLASTADADGSVGDITKILCRNNTLYLFQEHGIAGIGFNEKTAISVTNGVPLEIANSGKYTGLQYLTKTEGCQNKWSISNTKNGILFIDDSRQELMTFGENFSSVSTIGGMDSWFIKQLPPVFKKWDPIDRNNFVTYYDKLSNDIYYINNSSCLAWNEQINSFSSFYDYHPAMYIASVENHTFAYSDSVHELRTSNNYCNFFGTQYDYDITLCSDGYGEKSAVAIDKVFDSIDYRGDLYDAQNCYNPDMPFNRISAWTVYQNLAKDEFNLDNPYHDYPWKSVRKFNTWRSIFPRQVSMAGKLTDRTRGNHTFVKLRYDPDQGKIVNRLVLQDFTVNYTI